MKYLFGLLCSVGLFVVISRVAGASLMSVNAYVLLGGMIVFALWIASKIKL